MEVADEMLEKEARTALRPDDVSILDAPDAGPVAGLAAPSLAAGRFATWC